MSKARNAQGENMTDRQLIEDLLRALEYHTEQTRPIESSKVAIEAAREYLRKPAPMSEPNRVIAYAAARKLHDLGYRWLDGEWVQPAQQEPVAWIRPSGRAMLEAVGYCTVYASDGMSNHSIALCESPPQRKPLSVEKMFEAIRPLYNSDKAARLAVSHSKDEYRAIEAAHGIKENT